MPYQVDLDPDDIIVVPPDSGAQITVGHKSGRRVRLQIESAKKVEVIRARNAPSEPVTVKRPRVDLANAPTDPSIPPRIKRP